MNNDPYIDDFPKALFCDPMITTEVLSLADARGCVLNTYQWEGTYFYWVENPYFISKPFKQVDDLVALIKELPHLNPLTMPRSLS